MTFYSITWSGTHKPLDHIFSSFSQPRFLAVGILTWEMLSAPLKEILEYFPASWKRQAQVYPSESLQVCLPVVIDYKYLGNVSLEDF